MALNMKATSGGGDGEFELCPAGLYRSVCTRLITLGSHPTQWGPKPKVLVAWEVDRKMSDGRPFLVQSQYTLSLHEKAMFRQMLEQWRGKKYREGEDINLAGIVGRPCMINIRHQEVGDKTYANVDAVMPAQGDPLQPEGDLLVFDIDTPNMETFSKLSERLQEKIKSSPEWGSGGQSMPTFAGQHAANAEDSASRANVIDKQVREMWEIVDTVRRDKKDPDPEMPKDFDNDIPF